MSKDKELPALSKSNAISITRHTSYNIFEVFAIIHLHTTYHVFRTICHHHTPKTPTQLAHQATDFRHHQTSYCVFKHKNSVPTPTSYTAAIDSVLKAQRCFPQKQLRLLEYAALYLTHLPKVRDVKERLQQRVHITRRALVLEPHKTCLLFGIVPK